MQIAKKLFIFFFMINASFAALAQDAAPIKEVTSSNNMLAYTMIAVALILAFVIYALGQVLITLSRQVWEKQKAAGNKVLSVILFIAVNMLALTSNAQDAVAEEAVKVVPNYGGLSATAFWTLATVIIIEIIAISFMMSFIGRMKAELFPAKQKKPLRLLEWWKRMDKKVFTAAVPVEKEADIELDHEYDGIKELDNSLPPWWKWGFIITIFISIAYMLHFHAFGSGKNPTQEYEAELVAAKAQMDAYAAKNKDKVDESNIVMSDAMGIAAGEKIFQQVCWACHGKAGEGGAGPNLTDDYWMHKGSLTDIYLSIKHGYPDKGMQAWEKQYSPKQISDLTSYIKSLQGTNPAGAKAAQGDLYAELLNADSAAVTTNPVADSVKK